MIFGLVNFGMKHLLLYLSFLFVQSQSFPVELEFIGLQESPVGEVTWSYLVVSPGEERSDVFAIGIELCELYLSPEYTIKTSPNSIVQSLLDPTNPGDIGFPVLLFENLTAGGTVAIRVSGGVPFEGTASYLVYKDQQFGNITTIPNPISGPACPVHYRVLPSFSSPSLGRFSPFIVELLSLERTDGFTTWEYAINLREGEKAIGLTFFDLELCGFYLTNPSLFQIFTSPSASIRKTIPSSNDPKLHYSLHWMNVVGLKVKVSIRGDPLNGTKSFYFSGSNLDSGYSKKPILGPSCSSDKPTHPSPLFPFSSITPPITPTNAPPLSFKFVQMTNSEKITTWEYTVTSIHGVAPTGFYQIDLEVCDLYILNSAQYTIQTDPISSTLYTIPNPFSPGNKQNVIRFERVFGRSVKVSISGNPYNDTKSYFYSAVENTSGYSNDLIWGPGCPEQHLTSASFLSRPQRSFSSPVPSPSSSPSPFPSPSPSPSPPPSPFPSPSPSPSPLRLKVEPRERRHPKMLFITIVLCTTFIGILVFFFWWSRSSKVRGFATPRISHEVPIDFEEEEEPSVPLFQTARYIDHEISDDDDDDETFGHGWAD